MNLLATFNQLFDRQIKSVATISHQRQDGVFVATTLGGMPVLLTGQAQSGQKVFYDRISGQILSVAPDIAYGRYEV